METFQPINYLIHSFSIKFPCLNTTYRHGCGQVVLVLYFPYIELDLVTKIITPSQEQAHLLFPFDCNCTLQGRRPTSTLHTYISYKHVLGVVKLSLSYMVLIELDLVTKIVTSSPEHAHFLFPIDCNCMLQRRSPKAFTLHRHVSAVVKLVLYCLY